MLELLEKVILPVLATLIVYAIGAKYAQWSVKKRLWVLGTILPSAVALAIVAGYFQNRLIVSNPPPTQSPSLTPPPQPTDSPVRPSPPVGWKSGDSHDPADEFIAKYVAGVGDASHSGGWTLLFSSRPLTDYAELYAAAQSVFSEKGYKVRPLFRSTLLQDGAAYDELYMGNPALLKRLQQYREGFLIGKIRSEVTQNTSLDTFSAHIFLDLHILSTHEGQMIDQFEMDDIGPGFSQDAAVQTAKQRVAAKMKERLMRPVPSK